MNVLVLVKDVAVPGGTAMSGVDPFAVAAAVALAGRQGSVTVATLGPPAALDSLREALALGAVRAVHVLTAEAGDTDAVTAALALAAVAVRGGIDVVLTGRESTDARSGVFPAMVAEALGWPLLAAADDIHWSTGDDALSDGSASLTVRQRTALGTAILTATLPVVVSVAEYGAQVPLIGAGDLRRAYLTAIEQVTASDLGIPRPVGAPMLVEEISVAPRRRAGSRIAGDDEAAVLALFEGLGLVPFAEIPA